MKKPQIRKVLLLAMMFLLVAATAYADFTNGGFELGTFDGWTKGGSSFTGGYTEEGAPIYIQGDPGKSEIVTRGVDFYTNNHLSTVAWGTYAARVNNFDNNYHTSTLTQTATNWTAPFIYFGWAAVLEEPGIDSPVHNPLLNEAPRFSIILTDLTTHTTLKNVSFDVYNPPPGVDWKNGIVGGGSHDNTAQWKYNDWIIEQIDTSSLHGDTLELTVLAADCTLGAHGGYAYVDWFSENPPPPLGPVPLPSSVLLLGSGLLGLVGFRKKFFG